MREVKDDYNVFVIGNRRMELVWLKMGKIIVSVRDGELRIWSIIGRY